MLEGWCKDIDEQLQCNSVFHYSDKDVPSAKVYYVSHYQKFFTLLLKNPHILNGKIVIQYTHYTKDRYLTDIQAARFLNLSTVIYTMNEVTRQKLICDGTEPQKIQTKYIAVDPSLFYVEVANELHDKPVIGFNLRYQAKKSYILRKNYEVIIDIIKKIDFCDVVLLGKNWEEYDRFKEVADLPHFTYIESSYREYQKYYAKMDIFVSVSKLEGGPVPMLEAMFCNVFPVVSNTGFAPDLITNGENGILFDADSSTEQIIEKIKEGIKKSKGSKVANTVNYLTWKHFSQDISSYIK